MKLTRHSLFIPWRPGLSLNRLRRCERAAAEARGHDGHACQPQGQVGRAIRLGRHGRALERPRALATCRDGLSARWESPSSRTAAATLRKVTAAARLERLAAAVQGRLEPDRGELGARGRRQGRAPAQGRLGPVKGKHKPRGRRQGPARAQRAPKTTLRGGWPPALLPLGLPAEKRASRRVAVAAGNAAGLE